MGGGRIKGSLQFKKKPAINAASCLKSWGVEGLRNQKKHFGQGASRYHSLVFGAQDLLPQLRFEFSALQKNIYSQLEPQAPAPWYRRGSRNPASQPFGRNVAEVGQSLAGLDTRVPNK